MRKAGILMPVASLPSDYGIGDFGPTSYTFVNLLASCGVKIWQILPLNPLGYGNSPYQPYSSHAMDDLYLSLEIFTKLNLLKKVEEFHKYSDKIDYDEVRSYKQFYIKEAYKNYIPDECYNEFVKQPWVYNYAVFLTLKKVNHMQCWIDWPSEMKHWIDGSKFDLSKYDDDIKYEIFVQYMLYRQWLDLKQYANSKGIEIMGDIPIYVGIDSDDVWCNQKSFLLDDDGRPTFIAGVPPDYFSETGQRWGNPLYDWNYLKENNFSFWLERLSYNASLFDVIRIDHFRAFDTYWKIPSSCPTAQEGNWIEAPGYELFDTVFNAYPDIKIVAEDLGDLRDEVLTLRDHYNFAGMRIVQFTFNSKKMEEDRENLVIYTGTHDNQTIRSWYKDNTYEERINIKKYFKRHGFKNPVISRNFVAYTLASNASMAIIPLFDVLNLKDEARLNIPGTVGDPNWQWRIKDYTGLKKSCKFMHKMIKKYNR